VFHISILRVETTNAVPPRCDETVLNFTYAVFIEIRI